MNKTIYIFEVECIESGQRSAYQDSYYHYIVTNKSDYDYDDSIIKRFCMGFVKLSVEEKDMENPFSTKITSFKKIGDRKYKYKCESLFTG